MSIAVLHDKVVEKKNPASTFVQVDPILVTEESVKKFRDTWRDWIHGK
jgi:hypothetical protein